MADLEEAIGDRIPIAEELVVRWNADGQSSADAEQRLALVSILTLRRRVSEVERELRFEIYERVAHFVDTAQGLAIHKYDVPVRVQKWCIQVGERLCSNRSSWRYLLWPVSEDVCGKDVEQCRLCKRFDGVLSE